MNEFDKTTKNFVIVLSALGVLLLILGMFVRNTSFLNNTFGEVTFGVYALGVVFGIVFSIIKVFMIRISLKSTLTKSANKANLTSLGHFLFRYLVTGLVLYISIISSQLDFFGTTLGVLALQPASYISGYLLKKNGSDQVSAIQKQLDI